MLLGRLWARLRGKRYGEVMWTATGGGFYPLDPRAEEVTIEDIARGLATECRYAGQIAYESPFIFYSVAEHSYHVSVACEGVAARECWRLEDRIAVALEALLHDGTEAYIGDMIRPLKYERAMKNYRYAERLVERSIVQAFGLQPTERSQALVRYIDNCILTDEIDQLMIVDRGYKRGKYGHALGATVEGWSPEEAQHRFLTRYLELVGCGAGTGYVVSAFNR